MLHAADTLIDVLPHLLAAMPSGVILCRLETPGEARSLRVIYLNLAAETMTGEPAEALVGCMAADCWPSLMATERPALYVHAAETGAGHHFTDVYPAVAGQDFARVYDVRAFGLPGRHVAVTFEDVSLRKQHETAALERERAFRNLADNSPDVIARFDLQCRYLYINAPGAALFGLRPGDCLGRTAREFPVDPAVLRESEEQLARVFATGQADTTEWGVPTPIGVRWFQFKAVPEFAPDGSVGSVLRVSRDITDRIMAERLAVAHETAVSFNEALQSLNEELLTQSQELQAQQERLAAAYGDIADQAERLQAQNAQLERLARLKDEFLATVSHELRTPLVVIKNATTILKKGTAGDLNETQARFVAMVQQHSSRLTDLVDNILDLQKLESGAFHAEPRLGDVGPTLRTVAESFSHVLTAQSLAFDIALPSAPLIARHDAGLIGQVIMNLLSNAAKFTPSGGTIRLRAWQEGADICVTVSDTGIGIPADDLGRIFDKFVQVSNRLSRESGGTGLGLAICKRLIEEGHGGRIWAESQPNVGSTFTFTLPAA